MAEASVPRLRQSSMRSVRVTTGSRLHFGLTAFGRAGGRQYGGAGVMVDEPRTIVEVRPRPSFAVVGEHAERVQDWTRRLAAFYGWPDLPSAEIAIRSAPPMHAGLGAGTQLALAVAAALTHSAGEASPPAESLAQAVGRAERSAIGTHGFARGGLIHDRGKLPGCAVGEMAERIQLPPAWRFLLLRPRRLCGVSGPQEAQAFREMPAVPAETEARLERELTETLLPAARAGVLPAFGESLYRFNRLAGECYAAWQGCAYASPALEALVQRVRDLGQAGVGQSSWGPTLFVVLGSTAEAERLAAQLRATETADNLELTLARPRNAGATVEAL